MGTPSTSTHELSTAVDPQAAADLMAAIERVFKIGVYYPSGHALCDQAADVFLTALGRVVGKAPTLRFKLSQDVLTVQGFELDPTLRGVQGFRDLLKELGVAAVDVDSTVDAADLHVFVTQLLAYRNRVKGTHSFQQVVVEGMPPTIGVEHLEFIAREVYGDENTEGGDPSNPSVEALLATLARHGLGPEEIDRCRRLLESIPGYLENREGGGGALPHVTWADVEALLVRAAREPIDPERSGATGRRSSHASLDALAAIFEALGKRVKTSGSREAIDLLLSISRRDEAATDANASENAPSPASPTPPPKPAPPREAQEAPLSALYDQLAACRAAAPGTPTLATANRCEDLTILFQMFTRDQTPQAQLRIQKRIRDILRTPLQSSEWDVVVAGTRQLVELDDREHLTGPLRMVLEALRASEFASTLRYLADIGRGLTPERFMVVWPHLVNELLIGGPGADPEVFAEVGAMVCRPTHADMETALPMLESLDALRDRRCARALFSPPPVELYPVFAALLQSPHAPFIGNLLLSGMRFRPLNWLSESVLPLLGHFQPQHRRFLVDLLNLGALDTPPRSTAEMAGKIIAVALPQLPRSRRNEPWVATSVRALGKLPTPRAGRVLRQIVRARRLWLIPEWPDAARQAARQTLDRFHALTDDEIDETPKE